MDWKPIYTALFDRDVEIAVIDGDGKHALTFPCRRTVGGWVNAATKKQLAYTLASLGRLAHELASSQKRRELSDVRRDPRVSSRVRGFVCSFEHLAAQLINGQLLGGGPRT
jgi:hypothetical protein